MQRVVFVGVGSLVYDPFVSLGMALIESKPAFKQRCLQFGIPEAEVGMLEAGGQATFGAFAFIIPFANKDSADADDKLKAGVRELLGVEPSAIQLSKYRRLLFESHAVVMSDAKSRMERTEETVPRKLPAPERAQRHRNQVGKYPGITIEGWNEPSHSLLDECQSQLEEHTLRYIALEKCTCRTQELDGIKKVKEAKEDSSGFLKIATVDHTPTFDHHGDLFKVRQAFLRRALAYDSCGICSFPVLESWSNKLFDTMQRDPPPGFGKVTLWQALGADKELFSRLAEKCRDGLGPDSAGQLPVEVAIKDLMADVHLNQFLAHLPQGSGNRQNDRQYDRSKQSGQNAQTGAKDKGGRGKGRFNRKGGKGFGKGKNGPYPVSHMLPGLEGCWSRINRDPICQYYNLGKCNESARDGDRCSKGLHKCCKPKCGGNHPYIKCPGSSSPNSS